MALGPSEYVIDKLFDCLFNNTTFTAITQAYIQLHIGDPGASGIANKATDVTRKSVSFGAPAAPVAGSVTISNDAQIQWTSISGSQDATHFSLWDTATDGTGNFLGSGTITANAYSAGDTFTIPTGDLDISFSIAA